MRVASKIISKIVFVLFFLIIGCTAQKTFAASLQLAPPGSYSVGDVIPLTVYVSAASGESVNAVAATITYPTDKLALTSISKGGSIINLWVQEPQISSGSASFQGVTYNPGFTGRSGTVVTLYFKALAVGSPIVSFSNPQVLANDGQGTDILRSSESATLNIGEAKEKPQEQKPTPITTKPKPNTQPVVSSTTPTTTPSVVNSVEPENKPIVIVSQPDFLGILTFGVIILLLLFVLGVLAWYIFVILREGKSIIAERINRADADLHTSFDLLRDEISERIDALEDARADRELTAEEKKFLSNVKKHMSSAEQAVSKDIRAISRRQ